MKTMLVVVFLTALSFGQTTTTTTQDATALEEQYSTCEKHHIPADKCTPEIYEQLKAKDNAPLDPTTATALKAAKEYRSHLKNPASMQVQTAYVTDQGAVCLEIGAQNGFGGISVSRVVYVTPDFKGAKRMRGRWLDEGGFGGSASADLQRMNGGGLVVDRWQNVCYKTKVFGGQGDTLPGTDVTEKVNQALKRLSQ
jgi:hypothetical protein